LVRGIDPQDAARVTEIDRYLRAPCGGGELANLARPQALTQAGSGESRPVLPGVLVGCELAKSLRLFLGDDVQLAAPRGGLGPMGPMPRARAFRVAGIFYSGMYEYDSKMTFVVLGPAQRLLGIGDEVTAVELKLRDADRSGPAMARLRRALGDGREVRDWRESNRSLFAALKLERAAMFIVLGFIVLVAAFSIVTNLIMVVLHKGREIAILKAMGATAGAVLRVFVIQGLYIGVIGMTVGVAAGVAACLVLERHGLELPAEVYYIAQVPVVLDAADVVLVGVSALGVSLLATAYPSWLASRLRPADGIRYE
jgi:lipoprotein-releasing system permease protein